MERIPHGAQQDGEKFPKVALGLVAIAMFTNAFSLTVLFPFIGAMVQQLGLTDDPRELGTCLFCRKCAARSLCQYLTHCVPSNAGFYAGYIGAAFMVGRLCTSYFWGLYSDRYGRRPVMLVGMTGMVVFGVGFGLSFNFAWAIAMRVLTGMFNGIVGTGKTMVSELCSEAHQARGMSVVTATWGLGLVIGPAIGGLLAYPADTMPSVFPPETVWSDFPFFLPMLLSSIVAAIGLVPAVLFLPETLPEEVLQRHAHECGSPRFMRKVLLCQCSRQRSLGQRLSSEAQDGKAHLEMGAIVPKTPEVTVDEGSEEPSLDTVNGAVVSKDDALVQHQDAVLSTGAQQQKVPSAVHDVEAALQGPVDDSQPKSKPEGLLRNFTVMLTVCMYAVWSMGNIMMNEVLPIWGLAPRDVGGLDITTSEIGAIMASIGVFLVLFQTFAYHRIAACFAGPLHVFRAAAVVWIVAVLFMPSAAQVDDKWGRIVATAVFNCVRNALGTAAFTSIFMMVNNSAPSAQRGSVNGLSMVVGSIGKAVGPAVGANLFAWSVTSGLPFPLDYGFTFYFTAVVAVLALGMSFWLPHELNFKFENGLGKDVTDSIPVKEGTQLMDSVALAGVDTEPILDNETPEASSSTVGSLGSADSSAECSSPVSSLCSESTTERTKVLDEAASSSEP